MEMFNLLPPILTVNWSNITSNWEYFIMQGYRYVFQHWVYPLIFLGIIGYVYAVNRSAISAAVAICITFAVFGITGVFSFPETSRFVAISYVIVIFSFAAMFTLLFTKKGRV